MSDKAEGKKPASGGPSSTSGSGVGTPKGKGKGVDPEVKQAIKDNMKQVLNKLGNITDVIVKRHEQLNGPGGSTEPPKVVSSLEKAHDILKKLDWCHKLMTSRLLLFDLITTI